MNEKEVILAKMQILINNILDPNVKHVKFETRQSWGRTLLDLKDKLNELL